MLIRNMAKPTVAEWISVWINMNRNTAALTGAVTWCRYIFNTNIDMLLIYNHHHVQCDAHCLTWARRGPGQTNWVTPDGWWQQAFPVFHRDNPLCTYRCENVHSKVMSFLHIWKTLCPDLFVLSSLSKSKTKSPWNEKQSNKNTLILLWDSAH